MTTKGEQAHAPASNARSSSNSKRKAELLKASEDLDKKLSAVEYKLASPDAYVATSKVLRRALQVYLNLIWLAGRTPGWAPEAPSVAERASFNAHTDTRSWFTADIPETEMAAADADYQKVMKEDLPALNRSLADSNVAAL